MVYNPRVTVILDEMEKAIRNNDEVFFLGCNGELINGCIYNPFKTKIVCNTCKYFKKNDLSILSKKIKEYTISDFCPTTQKQVWEYTTNSIKQITYKGVDIGTACLSAYIEITRNQKPEITSEFKKMFDGMLDASAMLTDATENIFNELNPDSVYLFNGRIHTRRPVLRVAQRLNTECIVLEHTFFRGNKEIKKTKYFNTLPHDVRYNTKKINELWEKAPSEKRNKIGHDFYKSKYSGLSVDDISYTKRQKLDLFPETWDETKHNVVIYNSSDDEFASLGTEWDYTFGKDIYSTISNLLSEFKNNKLYHFYLRIHPNLKNISYHYNRVLYKLDSFQNLTIIHPESKISSYSLLNKADKIITFGSTIGIEAVYWRKPSILLKLSMYKYLGGNYLPENFDDFINMVKDTDLAPKDILPALKYGFFRKTQGETFLYFNPNTKRRFSVSIKDKLLFEYISDYRDELYKMRFPKLRNFIRYKIYSVPKNIQKRFFNNIPKEENIEAY